MWRAKSSRTRNADENANDCEPKKHRSRVTAEKIAEIHVFVSIH
jgi:hypothetical protein